MIKYFNPRLEATGWIYPSTGDKVPLYVDSVTYTFETWGDGFFMPHIEEIEASTAPTGETLPVVLDLKSVNEVFKLIETDQS